MSKNRTTLKLPAKGAPFTAAAVAAHREANGLSMAEAIADLRPGPVVELRPDDQPARPPIQLRRLHPGAVVPAYQTPGAAAFDFVAVTSHNIAPGAQALVGTGIAIWINDPGLALFLYSRSGHGLRNSVRLANCVGVIDGDYQKEIGVILRNDGDSTMVVRAGDRIAQGVVAPVLRVEFTEVREFSGTSERAGGFGSTGVA